MATSARMQARQKPSPPRYDIDTPPAVLKRLRTETEDARTKRERTADRELYRGAWARAEAWCAEHDLAPFYSWAGDAVFWRAHARDGRAKWHRFQAGRKDRAVEAYPPVATLAIRGATVKLWRRDDLSPLNLYVDGALVRSWAFETHPHRRRIPAAPVGEPDLTPAAADLLDRIAPAELGGLLRYMSERAHGGWHNVPYFLPGADMARGLGDAPTGYREAAASARLFPEPATRDSAAA